MPSGNLYLLSSSLGSNADLFAQQILFRNVSDEGKVAYYTVERSSLDVMGDMELFGMNIDDYLKNGSWMFTRLVIPSMKSLIVTMPDVLQEKKLDLVSLLELGKNFEDKVKQGFNTALHLSHLIRNFSIEEIQNLLFFMANVSRKYGGIQDRKSTRLNSSHIQKSRMPSSA